MIVVKLIDIALIIGICGYLGFSKSQKFYIRVKNLKDIKNSLNIFKSKIEFTYEPIKDIFEEISKVVYQDKENIFKIFCENINSNDTSILWNDVVENSKMEFSKDDKEIIKMLGKMLGKTDKARSN